MNKFCTKCKQHKDRDSNFPRCKGYADGYRTWCHRCTKEHNPSANNGTLSYFKTHRWQKVRYRCVNVNTDKSHTTFSYIKKGILLLMKKEEFFSWCDQHSKEILSLKNPSIDRIDNTKGYSIDNIRVIEREHNTSLGAKERWQKNRKPVIATSLQTSITKRYECYWYAQEDGFHASAIYRCLVGDQKKHKGYSWRYE